ncbi:NTE family protein [Thermosporothrix hazakensis]|jgi:NTE family protein|uniref:NTE family protein n=1 Tax=Thermosporothrix hazakensis TaxID=644383 RepID=A0A326UD69_THEHA|nr:patatin-like phospholipase family protein [Thermosporothrix hazakensis]PZW32664.1 NTE family protein [Thermosporothrix hazakensis]GCE50016.1 patatin [Thermosporothrix hazakensis]
MSKRALVLGGGGVAGIAWETGLLVGLADAGIEINKADLFVGTSAGSAVAAQVTSGLSMEELFQRQVDPALQAKEIDVQPNFQQIVADFNRITSEGHRGSALMRELGKTALSTPTVPEAERRNVIVSRLPVHRWPQSRLEIVAVDAFSGERVVFTRESGVELIDAVAASCAVPCVWPPVTIGERRYIDGGCYSAANADLAAGFEKVLIVQPEIPALLLVESLEEQIERLRQNGAQVEVLSPNAVVKNALAAAGGNPLDPALREISAKAGREQARDEVVRIAALWR